MKQNVTTMQIFDYINTNENMMDNIIKLAKATRTDYEGVIKFSMIFERKNYETAISEGVKIISLDFTIGKMIEILQRKEIKLLIDNCIPVSVKDMKNDKEYCDTELCDALWKAVIDNI